MVVKREELSSQSSANGTLWCAHQSLRLFWGLDSVLWMLCSLPDMVLIWWHSLFLQEHVISCLMKASCFLITWLIKCASKFMSWIAAGDRLACLLFFFFFHLATAICPFPQRKREVIPLEQELQQTLFKWNIQSLFFFFLAQNTLQHLPQYSRNLHFKGGSWNVS